MWNRWWIRIPVALVFGVIALVAGNWISVVLTVVMPLLAEAGELDFAGSARVHIGVMETLYFVVPTLIVAEFFGFIRKRRMWTTAYILYFTVFSAVLTLTMMALMAYAPQHLLAMADVWPLMAIGLAVLAGRVAIEPYLRSRRQAHSQGPSHVETF
ncbi:hypothetical protein PQU94_10700 [Asticcacaulis sp. DXS10W]|uniref:Uncharacterized protein n=1 Tax=Asticcacaulis currens TaxID=2984210 RepID=A0ABT5IH23_9CAUL|nr:hypothetical protein [Asticcacaulis currens]MDC7694751.1 hypothetical protein [Asticcacaulis currens]